MEQQTKDSLWQITKEAFHEAWEAMRYKVRLLRLEAKHRVDVAEALIADDFENVMRRYFPSDLTRQQLRNAALTLGQLGFSGSEDIEGMARMWHLARSYGVTIEAIHTLLASRVEPDERPEASVEERLPKTCMMLREIGLDPALILDETMSTAGYDEIVLDKNGKSIIKDGTLLTVWRYWPTQSSGLRVVEQLVQERAGRR